MATPEQLKHASALLNEGVTLGEIGCCDDAIVVFDELLAAFGTAADPMLRTTIARALFNKAITLGQLGLSDEAIATYDDVVDRFGSMTDQTFVCCSGSVGLCFDVCLCVDWC